MIERPVGMLDVRSAADQPDFGACRSPLALFSTQQVSAANALSDLHSAGAGNSERPFARPQRRLATITGSMLPVCPFDSTPETTQTRSIADSPPSSVSKPTLGEFIAGDPLSAPISSAPVKNTRTHSPLGHFDLPDQSVHRASSQETRLA